MINVGLYDRPNANNYLRDTTFSHFYRVSGATAMLSAVYAVVVCLSVCVCVCVCVCVSHSGRPILYQNG